MLALGAILAGYAASLEFRTRTATALLRSITQSLRNSLLRASRIKRCEMHGLQPKEAARVDL